MDALLDVDGSGNPLDAGARPNYTACPSITSPEYSCYLRVTVWYDYHLIFPFAPAFVDPVRLRSTYVIPLRAGISAAGAPTSSPIVMTLTPTESPTPGPSPTPTACVAVVPNLIGFATNGNPSAADIWAMAGFSDWQAFRRRSSRRTEMRLSIRSIARGWMSAHYPLVPF